MELIKNILVAIDFRESSDNIIENAIAFAKKFNAKLTLIHILPKDIENEKVGALVRESATEELNKANNRLKAENIKTGEPFLKFGNYSDKIVFTSKEIDANLIIIGAGEKQTKDSFQLGTTAGRVIRKSSIPVFVIGKEQKLTEIKNILCPVDFSNESSNALNNAIAIARLFNSKLIVLSAYTPFNQTITRIDPEEVNAQRKCDQEIELTHFLQQHNLIDLNYTKIVTGGAPAKTILKAIKDYDIDLLLMGTTGKSGINKILLGSVAEKVTREVLCSFITSKKEDFLTFELKTKDLKEYFTTAENFFEKGFYKQAANLYKACLDLNFSHIPSLKAIVKTHEKLGNNNEADKYREMLKNIMEQIQNFKLEEEK